MTGTCWAAPLNLSERRLMAVKLATAAKRFWDAADPDADDDAGRIIERMKLFTGPDDLL